MKKVIFNLHSLHDFKDYGISIPLLNKRVEKTVEYLQSKISIGESIYPKISINDLLLAHKENFVSRVENNPDDVVLETYELVDKQGNYNRYDPKIGTKPLSDFIEKSKLHIAGTYLCAESALIDGFAYHLGGGMHHAMSFKPGGFCMFNDIVISIRKLQRLKKISKAIVIDLDCHKGDGTAEIVQDDDSIFSVSIHMKNGWPLNSGRVLEDGSLNPSFTPSDIDIPVDIEDDYLEKLRNSLKKIDILTYDLAIVVHGVDVFSEDGLESSSGIKLTKSEVLERDMLVYNMLLASKIPQAWCLGGGYGPKTHELYIQFLEKVLSI